MMKKAQYKSVLFKIIKILLFLVLTLALLNLYAVDIYTKFKDSATTFASKKVNMNDFTFPPITFCMENGLKPSVMKKYGLSNIFEFTFGSYAIQNFNSSVWEAYVEASYILNRDFQVKLIKFDVDFEAVKRTALDILTDPEIELDEATDAAACLSLLTDF